VVGSEVADAAAVPAARATPLAARPVAPAEVSAGQGQPVLPAGTAPPPAPPATPVRTPAGPAWPEAAASPPVPATLAPAAAAHGPIPPVAAAAPHGAPRPTPVPPVQIGRIEIQVAPPPAETDPFHGCRALDQGVTARRGGGW
jgi:hypothetical protein